MNKKQKEKLTIALTKYYAGNGKYLITHSDLINLIELTCNSYDDLQLSVQEWKNHNFPNALDYFPLLGVQEEVGELSHAFLKNKEHIRGTTEEHRDKMADAIGDIVIFLTDFCNINNFSLKKCIEYAWGTASKRDWVKYPTDGLTK